MSCTHSHTTKIGYADSGAGPFTPVAQVVRISPPDIGVSSVECTHLDSPDYAREYIPGLIEGGSCSFDMRFDGIEYGTLYDMLRMIKKWQIVFPDGTTAADSSVVLFDGFFTALGQAVNLDDALQAMGVLKVTGKPAFTPRTALLVRNLPPAPPPSTMKKAA